MPALRALLKYWILWVILFIIALGAAAYLVGYRIDTAGFTRVGTLSIGALPDNTRAYVDSSRRVQSVGGTVSVALSPGEHTVIIDAPLYQPWEERYLITAGATTILDPFLIKKSVDHATLSAADAAAARMTALTTPVPSKAAPLSLLGGCALVYVSGTHVVADAAHVDGCTPPAYLSCTDVSSENPDGACATTIIYTPPEHPIAVLRFPGRGDALIVATPSAVYAVELNPNAPQTIVPLFKDAIIGVAPWGTTGIAVLNSTSGVSLSF